jgi:hypothetical protein
VFCKCSTLYMSILLFCVSFQKNKKRRKSGLRGVSLRKHNDRTSRSLVKVVCCVVLVPRAAGRIGLRVHSVRSGRPLAVVSSCPVALLSLVVDSPARQVDRAPIMGCLVLFPIGRERPQFYTLNIGPLGLESLPLSHCPHRDSVSAE